jgi:hypothetical protein
LTSSMSNAGAPPARSNDLALTRGRLRSPGGRRVQRPVGPHLSNPRHRQLERFARVRCPR